jgi:putative spermidine/putrescine transport system permease protein
MATLFASYVLALYGPMLCIMCCPSRTSAAAWSSMKGCRCTGSSIYSHKCEQGCEGGFERSIVLAIVVTILTVVGSFLAGLAFRQRFKGMAWCFI